MKILLTLLFFLPITAHAGLLDLLPLKAIERKMIYPLSPEHVDPTRLGLPNTTEHRIDHPSASIVVWSVPATGKSRATVLYFHGNAGNLALRAERFKQMQAQGFDVLAMSYRGSSGSTGVPSETAITNDALHLYLNAGKYVPLRAPRNLILYGESLGSAVAIALLAKLSEAQRPSGVILEAPFTSIPDMARAVTDVPDTLISRISDRWESLPRGHSLTMPTLVLHGTADEVTPMRMGQAIFKAAPHKYKNFIAVKGASHSGTWRSDTMPKLWRFINTYSGY
jgi:alpha-beta hydrolase superfamily lysophospholipase